MQSGQKWDQESINTLVGAMLTRINDMDSVEKEKLRNVIQKQLDKSIKLNTSIYQMWYVIIGSILVVTVFSLVYASFANKSDKQQKAETTITKKNAQTPISYQNRITNAFGKSFINRTR